MKSYKELDIKRISAISGRAQSLICGKDCFDGSDYMGTANDPENQIRGYLMLEQIYNELKPFLSEIKNDITKEKEKTSGMYPYSDLSLLEHTIKMYEEEAIYILQAERALDLLKLNTNILSSIIAKDENNVIPEELNTDKAKDLFAKIQWCSKDGNLYKWTGTKSLFGYFVDKTSDYLGIRPSNNRIPWDIYRRAFQFEDTRTAKQAVNDYRNKGLSEPEGFWEIKKLCS